MTDDTNLWDAFLNGDKEALGRLFSGHYTLLFQYGVKVCRNPALVEDCIQELFSDIWRNQTATPQLSIKAYLVRALKYKIIRQLGRDQNSPLSENSEDSMFELSHEDFLIDRQHQKEQENKVKQALTQLSARQQEIIYLKYYQNLSYEEVSTIMNINYQVARNLLYHSIKALKRLMGQLSVFF
ncbi:RNA polymerase sigma factor [Flavihumibacter petaseus]|uniref:Putative RNA polymerase ECF-type sigma factor n=1 Tax=Flavihumibacter petaseus NBRC 106054 TaxID=1220578 RepID=A0A0E9N1G0_9BACT|nr:sigma-70 family RNA polymerase sigma factor [Flavihumibacter petaseus]GAO43689.1 putative RNA polymerase ECF-type sigma factor [Flavihumibacter petaseus NBRC 106054]